MMLSSQTAHASCKVRVARIDLIVVAIAMIFLAAAAPAGKAQPTPQLSTRPSTHESRYSRPPEQEITFQQGLLHYQRKQLAEAEKEFASVIKADPADAEAYYYLGLSQLDQGKPADAVENFNQSVRLDPTSREVRAARATANIRLGRYEAAQADLTELSQDPAWASLYHYLEGQLDYAQGKLDDAAKEFKTARELGGTEAEPAGFYEGLTYIRMRELVKARSIFRESSLGVATSGGDRDPTVAAASRQLDAVLAAQQARNKPWEIQITTGAEWDSNVIQLGSGIPNPAGISHQSDWRGVIQPRGSYSFFRNGPLEIGLEGSGYFSWHVDLNDFDVQSYQAGPFVNYRISKNIYASARYDYNYILVGRDQFLNRNIVTPQVTFIEPKFGYTSAFYQFQTRDFTQDPADTAAELPLRRSGNNNAFGIVQGINLPAIFRDAGPANLEVSYRFENQEANGSDFDGNFHTIGATLYTPLPFWKLRADIGVSVDFDRYTHGNSLDQPTGDVGRMHKRDDTELDVVTGITKDLTRNLALRVDYAYTNNNSNVEFGNSKPYEYDRHQVGVRLIFSY